MACLGGTEIIIQEGKLLNREILSSGTAEGIDVAMFLAAMAAKESNFYNHRCCLRRAVRQLTGLHITECDCDSLEK